MTSLARAGVLELVLSGITVNTVTPGGIETEMTQHICPQWNWFSNLFKQKYDNYYFWLEQSCGRIFKTSEIFENLLCFYERLLYYFDHELEKILEYLEIDLDKKARGEIKELEKILEYLEIDLDKKARGEIKELEKILEYLEVDLDKKARGEIKEKVSVNNMNKDSPKLYSFNLNQYQATPNILSNLITCSTNILFLANFKLSSFISGGISCFLGFFLVS